MRSCYKNKIICCLYALFILSHVQAQQNALHDTVVKYKDTLKFNKSNSHFSAFIEDTSLAKNNSTNNKSLTTQKGDRTQEHTAPFYLSPLFIVTVSFIILSFSILFLYVTYKAQLQRILMSQKIRDKIASDLHDDVGSSLSSISLYSEIAKQQVQNNNPEAVPYFEKIGNDARQIIEEMNDIVWAINPKNDSMEIILKRMEAFAFSIANTKNITVNFQCNRNTNQVKLPMEKRRNLYLIFKETINNSIKYAECKNLSVEIIYRQAIMKLTITDDGKGFDATQTYMGNGLYNLKKRAEEMDGTIEINSAFGKGTVVNLQFKTT